MGTKELEDRIESLPPELRRELEGFLEYLLNKQKPRRSGRLRFDWAGALRDLGTEGTAVDWQHRLAGWRAGEE